MMMMMMMISNLVDEVVGSREEGDMDGDEVGVGEKSLHGHVLPVLYRLQGGHTCCSQSINQIGTCCS